MSHSICPAGAHDPIEWRRCRKRDACPEGACKDHTALCIERMEDAVQRALPGAFTFDSYCTSAKVLNPMQDTQRASVGDLTLHRTVVYAGPEQPLQAVAR